MYAHEKKIKKYTLGLPNTFQIHFDEKGEIIILKNFLCMPQEMMHTKPNHTIPLLNGYVQIPGHNFCLHFSKDFFKIPFLEIHVTILLQL